MVLVFELIIITFLSFLIQLAQSDTCYYYPNYPTLTPAYNTICSGSYTCCESAATNSYDACCISSNTSISNSFWWITLTVIGLIFLIISGTLITKLICYKKNKHLRLVGVINNSNNTSSLFRISGNPNYAAYDSQLPSYNVLPQAPLFERVNSEPPKYEEFIKSQQQNSI